MRAVAKYVGAGICAVAFLLVTTGGVACGSKNSGSGGEQRVQPSSPSSTTSAQAGPTQRWESVASERLSGDAPVKQYLGTYELGSRVRLAWVLSGAKDAAATLTLRVINVSNGTGYGQSVASQSEPGFNRRDRAAIILRVVPGEYRVFFSQRFGPSEGPGYDIKLTLYTKR